MKEAGNLEGILLTGLTKDGVDLMESYVDHTGDVQTASFCLLMVGTVVFIQLNLCYCLFVCLFVKMFSQCRLELLPLHELHDICGGFHVLNHKMSDHLVCFPFRRAPQGR